MAVEIASPRGRPEAIVAQLNAPVPFHVAAGLLRGLNREQRRAVTNRDGPQVVIAGPGTGKTEVITRRVAWLIATKRARPREILALTFTDNAAREMQARVDLLVPYGQADAAIHTFHAFGDRLLREHAFELGLAGDMRLINRSEAIVLLREHLFELGLNRYRPLGDPTRFLGALADAFGRAKDDGLEPSGLDADTDESAEVLAAFSRYQELLSQNGLIDHGDQISLALRLLRDHPQVRDQVAAQFRFVLVDEFQDMNRAQVELVSLIGHPSGNVTVVGDPDQAIYRFRGASEGSLEAFENLFPDANKVVLRRNYRSRAPIVAAAQRLIEHNRHSDEAQDGQVAHRRTRRELPVRALSFGSASDEADGVAASIAGAIKEGRPARAFAVLARTNGEVDSIARALRARDVAVRTRQPADLFSHPAVRPLLAFLRVVADPSNTVELYALATSWPFEIEGQALTTALGNCRRRHRSLWDELRSAPDHVGDGSVAAGTERLIAHVEAAVERSHARSCGEVLYDHIRQTGLLRKLQSAVSSDDARAVARFFEVVRSRASLLNLDRVAVLVPHLDALLEASDDDYLEHDTPDADAVTVLTVHGAKGLEFDRVFLTGLVDGRFPTRSRPPLLTVGPAASGAEADPLADERRLFFVAMTRARDELVLTHHVTTASGRARRPSIFIAETLDVPSVPQARDGDVLARIERAAASTQGAMTVVPHDAPVTDLSFSALDDYLSCPERYRLRHVIGLPTPQHHALSYGSAMHQAVAAFHTSRARGSVMTEEELLSVFRASWSVEGFVSREHEEARYAAGCAALVRFRNDQIANPADVVAVERPFTFRFGDVRIKGRLDRLDRTDEGSVIVDYKSSDVSDPQKANARARESLQLQVYAMAHEAETGRAPHAMQLHFLDTGVVGTVKPEPERQQKARAKIASAVDGIRAGAFEAAPTPMACGYCPYRQICASSAA
ncbi:MAG TPA: ATP-dependent DNA helicase [Candidatus Limnocylindrales bacterium]|nr:ATP-dependent DNA helicase [Candidatus Limnocylindrales bacterium]